MARKNRFPEGYSAGFGPRRESGGTGSSGRIGEEDTIARGQKWVDINSASRSGFDVPVEVVPLAKLSPSERKSLELRLRSDLERIRVLQKKFELQRINAVVVSSSNNILSGSNIKKGPQPLNKKKSAGQISRPEKKANPSDKKRGLERATSGRFVAPGSVSNPNSLLLKQCANLLRKLMSHQNSWVFNEPVDVVKLNIPDYFTVIKHPMDLGTIKRKLASRQYSTPQDFVADVRLTFSNAMTYNPPGNNVHVMADTMSKFFELKWKAFEKELSANSSQTLDQSTGLLQETEVVKPSIHAKKRKLIPSHHSVVSEPVKPRMTDEEKQKLSRDLEGLNGEIPDNIIDLLKEQSSNGGESAEDEIEIDIDDLSDDVLFRLRKLLDEHLLDNQSNNAIAERCEIELPNESELSSSSMQVDRGNDHVDEDIDIGGTEPPVSSYPPVTIEKDSAVESDRNIGTGRSDERLGGEAESVPSTPVRPTMDTSGSARDISGKDGVGDSAEDYQSISGLDQLEQNSQEKLNSDVSDGHQDGESAPTERQVSPEKLYRAALLKNRFADTIFKAREKALLQGEKGDPEKLRLEREKLEMQKMKEKARLQAEAKAAEDARNQAEAEAAAELKRKRGLERAAARQALLQMEKTVEINENSQFLEDLEMLRAGPPDQLPSSVDENSPDHLLEGLGSFKFVGSNPLEQLGLYMKADDEEEEVEPPAAPASVPEIVNGDVEEGEIE